MTRRTAVFCMVLLLLGMVRPAWGDDSKLPPSDAGVLAVSAADQLFNQGKFQDAADKYQAALKISANLESAQVGLALSLLGADKADDGLQVVLSGLGSHPDSARLLEALGNIKFRRGEMAESEQAYITALQIDPRGVRSYVGLAHLYSAYSLYGHAYAALKRAHEIDPKDPAVQLLWLDTLPRKERAAALLTYLATSHSDSTEDRAALEEYLHYLEKTAGQAPHNCKLTTDTIPADTKLQLLRMPYVEGVTLDVKVNDRTQHLLLDSGASGITISRKAAEKAKLQRLSDTTIYGIGDKGAQSGYLAWAEHLHIGQLEFQDCIVTVSDKKIAEEIDGLIGTDVFASYLIDLDIPHKVMKLSALPSRPSDATPSTSLNTQDESQNKPGTMDVLGAAAKESFQPPKDRYIAPEMNSWSRFFRFDHIVLVPAQINNAKPMLFMLDTGAEVNTLSLKAASSVTKVKSNPWADVGGVNGSVDKVYRADKINIQLGRLHSDNQSIDSIDLSSLCRSVGTEISGMFGFDMLSRLEIKIDYRDGLVDFTYFDIHGVSH
jgi:tetratricopeptide (TPR) repeat protein